MPFPKIFHSPLIPGITLVQSSYLYQICLKHGNFTMTIVYSSMICKFIKLQFESPTRGEWASSCINNLDYLNIKMSLEEIKSLSLNQFRNLLDKSINIKALEYLLQKGGSKGIEMKYPCIKMAEYLLPHNEGLSISDQRYIFSIRNRMIQISENFPMNQTETICCCGNSETMIHIYSCKYLNMENVNVIYKKIFEDNVKNHKQVHISKIQTKF